MVKETFSQKVKEEVSLQEYKKSDLIPLLSGFIMINGVLSFKDKDRVLILRMENSKVAKLIYSALKRIFDADVSFTYSRQMKLNKKVVYHLILKNNIDELLKELELKDGIFLKNPKYLVLDQGLRFFITGVFLASGSISNYENGNYHLQIIVNEEEDAKYVLKLLHRFRNEKAMDFKIISYRKKFMLYIKKADQISTFLSLIGATDCLFEFENSRIIKDFINSDNRLTICESANLQKTIKKSEAQIADINYLKEHYGFNLLNEKEKALCNLRIDNPEASLLQLAFLLKSEYNIQISKSGVNHILNTIHQKRIDLENGDS